jgi:3-methyladenine DNA glycosylase/8-oxoguanine DNA glycosylase
MNAKRIGHPRQPAKIGPSPLLSTATVSDRSAIGVTGIDPGPVRLRLGDETCDRDADASNKRLPVNGLFEALLFQLVGQNLSAPKQQIVYGRLRAFFPDGRADAGVMSRIPILTLCFIGLTERTAKCITDLACCIADGAAEGLADLSEAQAREELGCLPGISAQIAEDAVLLAFGCANSRSGAE